MERLPWTRQHSIALLNISTTLTYLMFVISGVISTSKTTTPMRTLQISVAGNTSYNDSSLFGAYNISMDIPNSRAGAVLKTETTPQMGWIVGAVVAVVLVLVIIGIAAAAVVKIRINRKRAHCGYVDIRKSVTMDVMDDNVSIVAETSTGGGAEERENEEIAEEDYIYPVSHSGMLVPHTRTPATTAELDEVDEENYENFSPPRKEDDKLISTNEATTAELEDTGEEEYENFSPPSKQEEDKRVSIHERGAESEEEVGEYYENFTAPSKEEDDEHEPDQHSSTPEIHGNTDIEDEGCIYENVPPKHQYVNPPTRQLFTAETVSGAEEEDYLSFDPLTL